MGGTGGDPRSTLAGESSQLQTRSWVKETLSQRARWGDVEEDNLRWISESQAPSPPPLPILPLRRQSNNSS